MKPGLRGRSRLHRRTRVPTLLSSGRIQFERLGAYKSTSSLNRSAMNWQFYNFWLALVLGACIGAVVTWLVIRAASVYQTRDYSGLKHHAKVHTFRIATAAATWLLIIASFYYHPEWIKWALRNITYAIETAADAIPYPWGDRIEIALRELGGFVWFQITLAIVSLRIALSIVAAAYSSAVTAELRRAA